MCMTPLPPSLSSSSLSPSSCSLSSPSSSSLSSSSPSSLSSLSSLSSPQSRIPSCPLCHQLVLKPRGETANDQIERHITSGCTALVVTSALERRRAKRCRHQHCRRRELIPFTCPECRQSFCSRHRHSFDHHCPGPQPTVPQAIAVH